MTYLAITKGLDKDDTALVKIRQSHYLKEQVDCELVHLTNDFYETGIQMNQGIYGNDCESRSEMTRFKPTSIS